ncbi:RHS repeat-associated core domain-containing protein [Curtobacterium sp. NPDC098951]|uniref:RHS repeat-associated core domain-containing protein n=1 Tax=Curtobacterium sp. NPDC098951 TaxID=3363974 RepID=UPI0037F1CB5D
MRPRPLASVRPRSLDDRLLTTTFADSALTVTNTYDGNGNQLTQQSATGTITNIFHQRNRLVSTVDTAGGGAVSYGYDLAGNTVRVTDQHGDVTHSYYPSNSRLTKAAQAGGATNTTWAYTYDAAGNRLTAKQTGDATSSQTLTYNAVGQITSAGYVYDGVGNLTAAPGETFTYNDAQQLTASTENGVTTRYEYAGADMNKLLKQSTDGGAEYDYTYGTADQHGVPVVTSRTVAGTGTASVISDPTTGQPMDLQTTDGVTSMWVIDGIGNPAAAIADTGNTAYTVSYDPYGAETIQGGSSAQWLQNPFGFKAGLRSSSTDNGLTKFGYRWQTSATGGWIERDSLDAPLDPQNANRYAFAGGDPVNNSDPTGRTSRAGKTANAYLGYAIGAVVGGAIGGTCVAAVVGLTAGIGTLGAALCGFAGAAAATYLTQDFEGPFN